MSKIFLYDHKYRERSHTLSIGATPRATFESAARGEHEVLPDGTALADGLATASHVVGHFESRDLEAWLTAFPGPASCQIILCVTTGHEWWSKVGDGAHTKRPSDASIRYFLFSRPGRPLSATEIRAFYSLTAEQAGAAVAGNADAVPADLRKLLFPIEIEIELLPAIAILCQGYLAAHAALGWDTQDADIHRALDLMGWLEMADQDSAAKMRASLAGHVGDVRKARWWQEPFEAVGSQAEDAQKKWRECESRATEEFNIEKSKGRWEDIQPLLAAIGKGEELDDPRVVAKAYLALAERFG